MIRRSAYVLAILLVATPALAQAPVPRATPAPATEGKPLDEIDALRIENKALHQENARLRAEMELRGRSTELSKTIDDAAVKAGLDPKEWQADLKTKTWRKAPPPKETP
jgi:hypothetical protein